MARKPDTKEQVEQTVEVTETVEQTEGVAQTETVAATETVEQTETVENTDTVEQTDEMAQEKKERIADVFKRFDSDVVFENDREELFLSHNLAMLSVGNESKRVKTHNRKDFEPCGE